MEKSHKLGIKRWFQWADTPCWYLTNRVPGRHIHCCPMDSDTSAWARTHVHTRARLIRRSINAHRCQNTWWWRKEAALTSPLNGPLPRFLSPHSRLLFGKRWCFCQTGARRPHKAGAGVTTNKNSAVTPRNLIRIHWFMLWIETEYLESSSSSQDTDGNAGAFPIRWDPSSSFSSHLWTLSAHPWYHPAAQL